MKLKNITKNLLVLSLIFGFTVLPKNNLIYADRNLESEFKAFIQNYDMSNLTVENGISLCIGDTINISGLNNVKLSNNNILKLVNKNEVKAVNEGTVYLSQTINNKVYVTEISVSDKQKQVSFLKSSDSNNSKVEKSNRSYYKVFIDPGHGGSDPGALGFGYRESDINLQVAKKVEDKLKLKGIDVKMSRSSDVFYSLAERAEMANSYGADAFVSIHQNSASSTSANGIETYYNRDRVEDKPLSDEVQNQVISQTEAYNRGVKNAGFAVLVRTKMTAALVECGFISNESEANKISNPTYQDKLATGIANGIESYLKKNVILQQQSPEDKVIATGTVTAESLNVRTGYGASYASIGSLSKGSKVQIVDTQNGWHKILFNGGYGYVSGNYVDIDENEDITQPPQQDKIIFSDIKDHWAKSQIENFADKGYIGGYDDNTFKPNNNITRAEFVKTVNKYFGYTESGEENFTDVNENAWYYKDICIGIRAGYINGYQDGTFRPNEPISRQEAASIVRTITGLTGEGTLKFVDHEKIGSWALKSVYALAENNIMGGYEDNTFRPQNKITRAEAVATLSRVEK